MGYAQMHPGLEYHPGKALFFLPQADHCPADRWQHSCHCQGQEDHPHGQIARQIQTILYRGSIRVLPPFHEQHKPQGQGQQNQQGRTCLHQTSHGYHPHTIPEGITSPHPIRHILVLLVPSTLQEQCQEYQKQPFCQIHGYGYPHTAVHGHKILLSKQVTHLLAVPCPHPAKQQAKSQHQDLPQEARCHRWELRTIPLEISQEHRGHRPQKYSR